ncbi:MAG: caspase family protein, partial [Pseudomonadota bacterium]
EMEAAFQEYGARLRAAGPDAIGVFFFAGHGMESHGFNYLIPIDAEPTTGMDLLNQAPRLNDLLQYLRRADNAVNIVILDACRTNPLPSERMGSDYAGGLRAPKETDGLLYAYATEPGYTAKDGTDQNSPYTSALVDLMPRPGLHAEIMLKRVRDAVSKATAGSQWPFYNSGLSSVDVYFGGENAREHERVMAEHDAFAAADGDPCAFRDFAINHPNSKLAKIAVTLSAKCPSGRATRKDLAPFQRSDQEREQVIDFGSADGENGNDGQCSDRRFMGDGMSLPPWSPLHVRRDATDCEQLWNAGKIEVRTQERLGLANIDRVYDTIDFGIDASSWANDGQCDDPRFEGSAMARAPSETGRDRSDCLVAYLAKSILLAEGQNRSLPD